MASGSADLATRPSPAVLTLSRTSNLLLRLRYLTVESNYHCVLGPPPLLPPARPSAVSVKLLRSKFDEKRGLVMVFVLWHVLMVALKEIKYG